jgi:hypothetical protein
MTVWIYVDTGKQVGDRNHLKVFASEAARKHGCRKTTRRVSRSNMRFWNEARQVGGLHRLLATAHCRLRSAGSEAEVHGNSGWHRLGIP